MIWKLFKKTDKIPATKTEELLTWPPPLAKLPTRKKEVLKTCKHCNTAKTAESFNKSVNAKDGLQPYCRVCQAKVSKKHHAKINKKLAKEANSLSKNSIAITIKQVPLSVHEKFTKIAEKRGCSRNDLYIDMMSTYLILNDK